MWLIEEPSQFSVGQTTQSITCSILEIPHTGLDYCLDMLLLSCFRKRMSATGQCVRPARPGTGGVLRHLPRERRMEEKYHVSNLNENYWWLVLQVTKKVYWDIIQCYSATSTSQPPRKKVVTPPTAKESGIITKRRLALESFPEVGIWFFFNPTDLIYYITLDIP